MFHRWPPETMARVLRDYRPLYPDPIRAAAGDAVVHDLAASPASDIEGWLWCVGDDGRAGWTPEAWIDRRATPWRMRRDYSAVELAASAGALVECLWSESGFIWARDAAGAEGWLPDGLLERDATESE